jgi:hypothetical protein
MIRWRYSQFDIGVKMDDTVSDITTTTSRNSGIGIAVVLVLIVILIVVVYYFFRQPPDPNGLRPIGPANPLVPIVPPANLPNMIDDCKTYGNLTPPGTFCPAGKAYFEGLCYDDVWTKQGGVKTATCTVSYGTYNGVTTSCGDYYSLNQGDPCPTAGPNYHKTAICTCQNGGSVTASAYCQNPSSPNACPPGTDNVDGRCIGAACPVGYTRTGLCTCQKNGT